VLSAEVELPEAVERIRVDVPDDTKLLTIFTDVVDCFLRHLNAVLVEAGVLAEDDFWRTVAACAADYFDRVPHLAERVRHYDLFAPEFTLSCLNRLQLRDNQQMIDLADPSAALQFVGTLTNPLAAYAPTR
jgi:siderophore synthetase component